MTNAFTAKPKLDKKWLSDLNQNEQRRRNGVLAHHKAQLEDKNTIQTERLGRKPPGWIKSPEADK